MTSPRERVRELADEAERLYGDAEIFEAIGMHEAALAADDQADAADRHALKVARESGNEDLAALWDEQ